MTSPHGTERREAADRLGTAFRRVYGLEAAGVWHAPGRANLIGEHTDYNDGLVLPIALPWGVNAAAAPTGDGTVEVRSAQMPEEPVRFRPAELGTHPPTVEGWGAYVAGVFWALREAGHLGADFGARIHLDSDLPVGASLSSSAALECAVLVAAAELGADTGLAADRPAMARLAQRAENEFVGASTGIMDQSAALRCRGDHALFLDCRTGGARHVPFALEKAGLRLVIINTRIQHALAHSDDGYAARRRDCERAARLLGVDALRDVEDLPAALDRLEEPVLRARVRHVVTEIHRVNAAVGLLRGGAVAELGSLFTASHLSLRDQYEVSCPELDVAVEEAVRHGARGARMTGGGFGGSAIALVPEERVADVYAGVSGAYAERGWPEPEFRTATAASGAHRLR